MTLISITLFSILNTRETCCTVLSSFKTKVNVQFTLFSCFTPVAVLHVCVLLYSMLSPKNN